jgi:NADH:ubiquinone oxidoreductase subunit 6 (subunit J)
MDVIIFSGASMLLFLIGMLIRDGSGEPSPWKRKQIVAFWSIAIFSAVSLSIISTDFPKIHWWEGAACAVGFFLMGQLTHYLVT